MRIGVISEGHADRAVITNILTGLIGIDSSDIEPLRPIDRKDETDKAQIDPQTFGGWTSVKEECENRKLIDDFLAIEGQDYIVIHLDTAEANEYPVDRPNRTNGNYCLELRQNIINQINNWLKEDLSNHVLYAVAIEEIDAWILPIYEAKDSIIKTPNPKERLSRILSKKNINSTQNYDNYLLLSKPLSKERNVLKGNFLEYNCSLKAFFEEVRLKVLTEKNLEEKS